MTSKAIPINEEITGDFTWELYDQNGRPAQVRGLNVLLTNMAGSITYNYKSKDAAGADVWLLLESYSVDSKDSLTPLDGLELQIVGVGATGANITTNDSTAIRNN